MSEEEIVRFATAYDPQWFHTDAQAASAKSRFGGLIASGWHPSRCGWWPTRRWPATNPSPRPAFAYVKWPHPVRPR